MLHETPLIEHMQAADSGGLWSRAHRLLTIGLVLTVVGSAFEALAVATTLPLTIKELGGLSLYGWAFSAFMLTNLIGITIAGDEADRQGPARPFLAGVICFALGLVIAGLAPSMLVLIAGRAVQGLGAGVISAVAYAAIARGYPEALKPQMLAVISTAWVVPGLVGPALAGIVAQHVGWRWVFLGLAPLPLIAACLAWPALRHFAATTDAPRDWRRIGAALRLSVGAGLLVSGLGAASALLGLLLAGAGLALGLPALRVLLPAGTLRAASGLPAAVATNGLLSMAYFGADAFLPLALTSVRGQSVTVAGLALTAATLCWSAGSWLQAHFAPQQSRRRLVLIGLAITALGIGGAAATLHPSVPVVTAWIAWGVAALGVGLAFSTIALVVLETAPDGQEGAASASMQVANVLGIALGTGIGGVIVAVLGGSVGAPGRGILTQDALMIGAVVLAMLSASRLPRRAAAASS